MFWGLEIQMIWVYRGRMLRMELPGRRKIGRPKRRFTDAVKDDMQVVSVT